MEKHIIGEKTIINYVNLGFSYKVFFVLGMLHTTFIQYLRPRLNNSPSPNKSPILSFSFRRS